jgi:hypothetical protein
MTGTIQFPGPFDKSVDETDARNAIGNTMD